MPITLDEKHDNEAGIGRLNRKVAHALEVNPNASLLSSARFGYLAPKMMKWSYAPR